MFVHIPQESIRPGGEARITQSDWSVQFNPSLDDP